MISAALGWLAFVVVPLALLGLIIREAVLAHKGRLLSHQFAIIIGGAEQRIRLQRDATGAAAEIQALRKLVDRPEAPRFLRNLTLQFAESTRQALYSETHALRTTDDSPYLLQVADALSEAQKALDEGDLFSFATATGSLLALDALDKKTDVEPRENESTPPEWVTSNAEQPLVLLAILLDEVAGAVEQEDARRAKKLVEHARAYLPQLVSPLDLALPLLLLEWARSHLHYVFDAHVGAASQLFGAPEVVVAKLFRRAAKAAQENDAPQLIRTIAWSDDPYTTPRF